MTDDNDNARTTQTVRLPELSADGSEIALARWLVQAGAHVQLGDPLAELESDKAVVELTAEHEGYVDQLLVAEGVEGLTAGAALLTLVSTLPTSGLDDSIQAAAATEHSESAEDALDTPSGGASPSHARVTDAPAPNQPPPERARATPGSAAPGSAAPGSGRFATPLANSMAAQSALGDAAVVGTGAKNRVTAADISQAYRRRESATEREQPAPTLRHETPSRPPTSQAALSEQPSPIALRPSDRAAGRARHVVARRLSAAKRDIPHYYMTRKCNAAALQNLRRLVNAEPSGQVRISVNDVMLKLVATALRRSPVLNASWTDDGIQRHEDIHLAMAVASPFGLLTPVIRFADRLGLSELAHETHRLGQRAHAGELTPDEYRGATFTVSNLGMYAVDSFSAIIDPPQAAILAVAAIKDEVGAVNGSVEIMPTVNLTLSVDHRVADGVDGAGFLATLSELINDPRRVLL